MRTITWYIMKQVLAATILAAVALCLMVWLFRSLQIVDMVLNRGFPFTSFVYFASLQLPRFLLFVAPMAVFGAALFTYNKLMVDSELVILRASGLSQFALAKPAIILSVLISATAFYLSLYLVPITYSEYKELEIKYRHDLPRLLLQEGVFTSIGPGMTVFFRSVSPEGDLEDVLIHRNKDRDKPETYLARKGRLKESKDGRWVAQLEFGSRQILTMPRTKEACTPSEAIARKGEGCDIPRLEYLFGEQGDNISLNLFSGGYKRDYISPRERRFAELLNWQSYADDVRPHLRAELHYRLTISLLPLTAGVLGIAILLSGSFSRRGQFKSILAAILAVGATVIVGHLVRNYAPRMPFLIYVMYANALIPLAAALISLIWPRRMRRPPRIQPS
jgi:lipopolysaccharide export system permease protein